MRARTGRVVCKDHEGTAIDIEMSRGVIKLEREVRALMVAETQDARLMAAVRFRQRVERGDFAAIFSGKFRELVQQGAQEGLTNAAGALQLAIVRLLMEEQDPTKMATALSKVANATANVMKVHEQLNPGEDPMARAVNSAWAEFDATNRVEELKVEIEQLETRKRNLENAHSSPAANGNDEENGSGPATGGAEVFGDEDAYEAFMEKEAMRRPEGNGLTPEMIRMGQEASKDIVYEVVELEPVEPELAVETEAERRGTERARWQEAYIGRLQAWDPEGKG